MERTKTGLLGICGGVETAPRWRTAENREGAQARYRDPGTAVASEISFWKINGRGRGGKAGSRGSDGYFLPEPDSKSSWS
jgi:hypothetical protein